MKGRRLRIKVTDDLYTPIVDEKIDYDKLKFDSLLKKVKKKLF